MGVQIPPSAPFDSGHPPQPGRSGSARTAHELQAEPKAAPKRLQPLESRTRPGAPCSDVSSPPTGPFSSTPPEVTFAWSTRRGDEATCAPRASRGRFFDRVEAPPDVSARVPTLPANREPPAERTGQPRQESSSPEARNQHHVERQLSDHSVHHPSRQRRRGRRGVLRLRRYNRRTRSCQLQPTSVTPSAPRCAPPPTPTEHPSSKRT